MYPPQYRELRGQAQEAISVTLLNEESPSIWEQVSDWVDQGLLVSNQTTGTKNRIYFKPNTEDGDESNKLDLLAKASESKSST